jgi:hypothetical protein
MNYFLPVAGGLGFLPTGAGRRQMKIRPPLKKEEIPRNLAELDNCFTAEPGPLHA